LLPCDGLLLGTLGMLWLLPGLLGTLRRLLPGRLLSLLRPLRLLLSWLLLSLLRPLRLLLSWLLLSLLRPLRLLLSWLLRSLLRPLRRLLLRLLRRLLGTLLLWSCSGLRALLFLRPRLLLLPPRLRLWRPFLRALLLCGPWRRLLWLALLPFSRLGLGFLGLLSLRVAGDDRPERQEQGSGTGNSNGLHGSGLRLSPPPDMHAKRQRVVIGPDFDFEIAWPVAENDDWP